MPSQPLTTSLWQGDWSSPDKLSAVEKVQLEESDIVSFHNYDKPADFEKRVQWLQQYHRPVLCTEFLARDRDSTFQGILPIAKKYNVAAFSYGLVAGKPRRTCRSIRGSAPYRPPAAVWHQDIFRDNGTRISRRDRFYTSDHGAGQPDERKREVTVGSSTVLGISGHSRAWQAKRLPHKTTSRAHQRGTDAFVCQPWGSRRLFPNRFRTPIGLILGHAAPVFHNENHGGCNALAIAGTCHIDFHSRDVRCGCSGRRAYVDIVIVEAMAPSTTSASARARAMFR